MILGVLSDTHGNRLLMYRAVDLLMQRLGAGHLIHLGDDWEDYEELDHLGYPVTGVPGLWCRAYHDRRIPKMRLDIFGGAHVAYAHDITVLGAVGIQADLLLSGHTHRANIETRQGVPHMNPGHLKNGRDRGQEATCGLVCIDGSRLTLAIYNLEGQALCSRLFPLGRKDKEMVYDCDART